MPIELDRLYKLRELASLKPEGMAVYRFHRLICSYLIPKVNHPGYCGILGSHLLALIEAEAAGQVPAVAAPEVPGYIIPGRRITPEDLHGASLQQYQNHEDAPADYITHADVRRLRANVKADQRQPGETENPGDVADGPTTESSAGSIAPDWLPALVDSTSSAARENLPVGAG